MKNELKSDSDLDSDHKELMGKLRKSDIDFDQILILKKN